MKEEIKKRIEIERELIKKINRRLHTKYILEDFYTVIEWEELN